MLSPCHCNTCIFSMSSARARRLTVVVRVPPSPVQQWDQAMRYSKREATTLTAEDASGRDHQEKRCGPENSSQRGHENPSSKSSRIDHLRSPEIPNFRRPAEAHNRVLRYGRNEAGDTNRTASTDSAYLGQADDVHAMRSAYNDAHERHLKCGTNAGAGHPASMAPLLDRALPKPDAASATAGVINQVHPNVPFTAPNQRLPGDIPHQHNSTSLAQEYHVHKAQIHASLWQQEIRKQAGNREGNAELSSESPTLASDLRESKGTFGWRINKTVPEDWETFNPSEGEFYDESPVKEETLMLKEFEKRRERNRIQIATFVKQHLYGRRRPVDGWKYIINNFGMDPKAAKGSAFAGRQTTGGNELEKLALKRESGQLRRKA